MEKAPGVQLYKKWADMNGTAKLALTRNLVELESQLASIRFPASGSLYLRETAATAAEFRGECRPLSVDIDPSQSYCVGPSADRSWSVQPHRRTASTSEFSKRPCKLQP